MSMFFQNHWKISGYPIFQPQRVLKTLFWEAIEIAKVRTTTSRVMDIKILSHFFTPPPIQYLIEKHWFFSDFPLFARNQNLLPTHHMCLVKLISKESLMSLVNQKNKIWAREFLNSQILSFDYNKCIFALIFPEKSIHCVMFMAATWYNLFKNPKLSWQYHLLKCIQLNWSFRGPFHHYLENVKKWGIFC